MSWEKGKSLSIVTGFPGLEASTMVEQKKLSVGEVRRTIATSLGMAFGLVIGLLWSNVVMGGLKVGGIDSTLATFGLADWVWYLITAIVLTIVMVILIIVISRWGSK